MQELAGKVAIVTGASKGMGRHFVDALVKSGARVACLARPSNALESLRSTYGEAVLAIPCDVALPEAASAATDQTVEAFGRIDVLVNNAAIYHPFSFESGSDAIIRNHVDVNILGVAWMIRAAIPHLRKTRGQIVTISSESVRAPFPMLALYAATKAAIETLSEGLRAELREDGVRVSILRSGSVSGGAGASEWSQTTREAFFRKIVATGHAAMSGAPASPDSMARALVAVLTLPPDVSADLIEVRAAAEGVPEGARAAASGDT